MKIRNWCRKLFSVLVVGGLISPVAAHAAGLGVNLVANPGFELVDISSPGVYSALKVLNWTDGTTSGFAYNYGQNYDNGGPLAGGGTYYFTPNQSGGTGTDVTAAGAVMQIIDVSAGASGAKIASGTATYNLSAFFTSYITPAHVVDGDIGNIELRFVDASNVGISTAILSDNAPFAPWKQLSKTGAVPVGTAKFYVSLYGTPVKFGPDGYLDNLSLKIVPEPSAEALAGIGIAAAGLRRRRDDS